MLTKSLRCVLAVSVLVGQLPLVGCSGNEDPTPVAAPPSNGPPRLGALKLPKSLKLSQIQAVLKTTKEIKGHQVTLCSMNSRIDEAIKRTVDSIPYPGLEPSDSALLSDPSLIDNLSVTTRSLRAMAKEVIGEKDEYLKLLHSFEEPIGRAPAELRRVATLFKQFLREEKYEAFRADYLAMAQMFTGLANRYELQQEQFAQEFNEEEYLATIAYLERGALMLDRFEAALEIAKSSREIPEAVVYMENLRAFIQAFEDFRLQLRRVNDVLDGSNSATSADHDTDNRGQVSPTDGRTA